MYLGTSSVRAAFFLYDGWDSPLTYSSLEEARKQALAHTLIDGGDAVVMRVAAEALNAPLKPEYLSIVEIETANIRNAFQETAGIGSLLNGILGGIKHLHNHVLNAVHVGRGEKDAGVSDALKTTIDKIRKKPDDDDYEWDEHHKRYVKRKKRKNDNRIDKFVHNVFHKNPEFVDNLINKHKMKKNNTPPASPSRNAAPPATKAPVAPPAPAKQSTPTPNNNTPTTQQIKKAAAQKHAQLQRMVKKVGVNYKNLQQKHFQLKKQFNTLKKSAGKPSVAPRPKNTNNRPVPYKTSSKSVLVSGKMNGRAATTQIKKGTQYKLVKTPKGTVLMRKGGRGGFIISPGDVGKLG